MSVFVLDASVAAKWFLPAQFEPDAPLAYTFLERLHRDEIQLVEPDLFFTEIGNAVWKAVERGRLDLAAATTSLTNLVALPFTVVSGSKLVAPALALANRYKRTVYDSSYLATAIQHNATLVTADERFANSVAAYLPVRWLRTFL